MSDPMSEPISMPEHPSQFETDFIAALFDRPADALKGFDVSPVGTGQVADSFRMTLDWDDPTGVPASLVAKCPAADATSRETARSMNLYEVETQFYEQFEASCGARVPHCYWTGFDAASGDGLLLFEDMAPARQIAQMDGCSLAELELVLDEAALLHKSHWNDPLLLQLPWLSYGKHEDRRAYLLSLLPTLYPEWRARYEGRIATDLLDMGDELVARFEAYLQPQSGPEVLTHGDMRLDNTLFTDKDGRAVLLDWQGASVGNPMGDIAYTISTGLADSKQREAEEAALVARYHAALGDCVGAYDYDAAWADYRRAAFAGFITAMFSAMIVERTERGDEMFAVMAERSGWQALHLDSLSLI